MRPLLASIVAISMLLPSLAYFAGTRLHRHVARKEARRIILNGLPPESLFRLALPLDGNGPMPLEWLEEGEFRYEGMMYDVVSTHQTEDSLILLAWADLHEAEWESGMDLLMARLLGTDPLHADLQKNWSHLIKQLFSPPDPLRLPLPAGSYSTLSPVWAAFPGGLCSPLPPTPPPQSLG